MREGVTAMDFHAPPDDGTRPGFAAHLSGWSRTRLMSITPLDRRLEALVRTIDGTCNLSCGVQFAQFRIDADPDLVDYFSHNRIEADFFCHFFAHPDVCEALPLVPVPHRKPLGFRRETGPKMAEVLERAILDGGAYRRFSGSQKDARKLVTDFGAAIGDRFATAGGWLSEEAWNPWSCDGAWDRSYFWFDRGSSIATVLLTTDSD